MATNGLTLDNAILILAFVVFMLHS